MIKAVLLDLDDTLIISQTDTMFNAYLRSLGIYGKELSTPEMLPKQVMQAYIAALRQYDPAHTLADRFFKQFTLILNHPSDSLRTFFEKFYIDHYPELVREYVTIQPSAIETVRWLVDHGYQVVVATNPALPEVSILQRLESGGLTPADFSLITTLETMHFGKPQPEYYEEILLRLDVEANEAIMVGDSWENDIAPALAAGLSVYWLNDADLTPDQIAVVDGHGTFADFGARTRAGWLATLRPHNPGNQGLISRLAAFPAAVAAAIEGHLTAVLECSPGDREFSARDIICHLRDHDAEEDRTRLERILNQDRPFISGNYDPWSHAPEYSDTSAEEALTQFVRYRSEMVAWLKSLPPDIWSRPARHAIFGPTSFEEMVRFATEHDRTHLRQMRAAIKNAVVVCGTT